MNDQGALIPLTQLPPGQIGEVRQLTGQRDDVHRLEELGFRKGTLVEMVRQGSPCIVKISGSRFCFRPNETLGVLVR